MKYLVFKVFVVILSVFILFSCGANSKYDNVGEFVGGYAVVNLNGKYGAINEKNEEVIPCQYEHVGNFVDGIARVKLNNKVGLIDTKGSKIVEPKYDKISLFSKGLAKIELNNKSGYLDEKGKEIIPPKYEAVNYNIVGKYFEVAENGIVKRIEKNL
jgi:hypothetical protein